MDILVHQLQVILVPGQDQGVDALLLALQGDGADEVIRLIARQAHHPQAHGGQNLLDHIKLGDEGVRHGGPVLLVFFIGFMAEHRTVLIKQHHAVLGVDVLKGLEQHAQKAVHRIGGHAGRIHVRQAEKSPVHQAVAIHQNTGFPHTITSRPLYHSHKPMPNTEKTEASKFLNIFLTFSRKQIE